MIPLFPYRGMVRPIIMAAVICLTFLILRRRQGEPYYWWLLLPACIGYGFFLIYSTFLSRTASEAYAYRLELMGSARSAFTVVGGLWSLTHGDFASIRIDNPRSLEGILINILLMVPFGYLLPQVLHLCGRKTHAWMVILCGSLCSALIEVIQLFTRLGMLDVDDWLMNTIGTGIGCFLLWLFSRKCWNGQ